MSGALATGPVLDTSVALAWCFPEERDERSSAVLVSLGDRPAVVPNLWYLEVANTLVVTERRGRCTQEESTIWLGFLEALPIIVDEETRHRAFADTIRLARSYHLSAYDAAYLELALRRGLPLATLDRKLRAAAEAAGVATDRAT